MRAGYIQQEASFSGHQHVPLPHAIFTFVRLNQYCTRFYLAFHYMCILEEFFKFKLSIYIKLYYDLALVKHTKFHKNAPHLCVHMQHIQFNKGLKVHVI